MLRHYDRIRNPTGFLPLIRVFNEILDEDTIYCPHCHKMLEYDEANFCEHCGAKLRYHTSDYPFPHKTKMRNYHVRTVPKIKHVSNLFESPYDTLLSCPNDACEFGLYFEGTKYNFCIHCGQELRKVETC